MKMKKLSLHFRFGFIKKDIQIKIVLMLNLIFICETLPCIGKAKCFCGKTDSFDEKMEGFNEKKAREEALTTVEIAEKYSYPIKEYVVTTKNDVCKLRLYRIPHGRGDKPRDDEPPRIPVLLMHGIVNASDIWLLMGPEKGFGFVLADRKYDVWLGDFRGSRYSNALEENKISKKNNMKYWDASFHEMGKYDYPAFIDKIIKTKKEERGTGNKDQDEIQKVIVIGYSMGSTGYYVLLSEDPDYVQKNVEIMISLAPVAFLTNSLPPFMRELCNPLAKMMQSLGVKGLDGKFMRSAGEWLPMQTVLCQKIFRQILFLMSGKNYEQLDMSIIPLIFGHIPSGFTTKTLLHYGQLIESDDFRKYDHGTKKNQEMYQQDTPPIYKFKSDKSTVPIILCYGINDPMSTVQDLTKLFNSFKEGTFETAFLKVNDDNFNHSDFLFAKDVVSLLYVPVIESIEQYYANNKTLKGNSLLHSENPEDPVKNVPKKNNNNKCFKFRKTKISH